MFITFCLIGVVNTIVDLILFISLQANGMSIIVANILSTSVALLLSYVLNKRFTFKHKGSNSRTFVPFVLVTLSGLWILQPIVIYGVIYVSDIQAVRNILQPLLADYTTTQNILGKLAATPASLVWNFVLYKKLVFKSTMVSET